MRVVSHGYHTDLTAPDAMLPMCEPSNPMACIDDLVALKTPHELTMHKAHCKAAVQRECGLASDASARLLMFVGQWTYENGIDLVVELVNWLYSTQARTTIFSPEMADAD